MSKIGHYLQEHVIGEVLTSTDVRRYFATDASILTLPPALVVYPHDENDVRKIARFSWQLAERNRIIPITARGSGTDLGGGALGDGIMVVFPAHMNRIVEFDSKSGLVTVEPGINYGKLQQTLMTHGRFLPPYPASLEYSTIGGAVANNASGDKSVKYGDTRTFVRKLRVVLANGEVIDTGRLSKREVSKKLGLATFEGEIYRGIDALLEEKHDTVSQFTLPVTRNAAGYDLADVRHDDGSIDLTPLFVGSQGTLGIVSEVTLSTEEHNPETTLFVASFDSIDAAQQAIVALRTMSDVPSAIEMIDGNLLQFVARTNPSKLKTLVTEPYPAAMLLVEFDNGDRQQRRASKKAKKILDGLATAMQCETELDKQSLLWKIRELSILAATHTQSNIHAVPLIDDGIVPLEKFGEYLQGVYALCRQHKIVAGVWGHAGEGSVRVQPHLDLGQIGDRQRAFRMFDEYNKLVIGLGGSTTAAYNDGRLRAPYLKSLYGDEMYGIFQKVKQIFDPYGTLNPGVKMDVSIENVRQLVRDDYGHAHRYDHLPRS